MDSIRQKIIDRFTGEASEILVANGYATNIGQNVFKAVRPGAKTTSLVVIPQPEQVERTAYKKDRHVMPVRFEGFVPRSDELDPVSHGEKIYQDIVTFAFSVIWGGADPEVDNLFWVEGGVENYPESRDEVVGAYAVVAVDYLTRRGDPFSQ